jgi:C4-dicarboxylate-specific signal transduction histidine kinase
VATANELSTTLAHELNQPLGVILSNAEAAQKLLENHSFDVPQFREIMADIVKADRRAADVITRLRDLLRRDDPNLKDLAINEAVEEVLALLRADFASRRIGLDTNLGHRLPLVRADRVLVVQVLLNLLTNASDAVADNSPEQREIVVTTSLKDGQIVVTVTDNGSGLPDAPESVFDPFFTTKDSGLGMGLAISRTIATSHDGKLWAESAPTGGTSFYFSLPGIRQAA